MNPKEIASKKFEKAALGYKPEEVEEYLKDVAVALATAMKEKEESEAKIVKLVERINEYRQDEDAIRDALLVAQKQGNRIIAESKQEAEGIIAAAQAKRDALLADIQNDCEALKRSEVEKIAVVIKEENDKLNSIVAASKTQSELQAEKLGKLKLEVSDFKKKLILILEEQVKIAATLPELTDEEIDKIVSGKVKVAEEPKDTPAAPEVEEPKPEQSDVKAQKDKQHQMFGFSEPTYKKQEFSYDELKFGHNKK